MHEVPPIPDDRNEKAEARRHQLNCSRATKASLSMMLTFKAVGVSPGSVVHPPSGRLNAREPPTAPSSGGRRFRSRPAAADAKPRQHARWLRRSRSIGAACPGPVFGGAERSSTRRFGTAHRDGPKRLGNAPKRDRLRIQRGGDMRRPAAGSGPLRSCRGTLRRQP